MDMEKIRDLMLKRAKSSHTLMLLAGAYLLYLAYDMLKLSDFPPEESKVLFYIFSALFIIVGILFVAFSGYALAKGYYRENVTTDMEEDLEDLDPDNEFEDRLCEDEPEESLPGDGEADAADEQESDSADV